MTTSSPASPPRRPLREEISRRARTLATEPTPDVPHPAARPDTAIERTP